MANEEEMSKYGEKDSMAGIGFSGYWASSEPKLPEKKPTGKFFKQATGPDLGSLIVNYAAPDSPEEVAKLQYYKIFHQDGSVNVVKRENYKKLISEYKGGIKNAHIVDSVNYISYATNNNGEIINVTNSSKEAFDEGSIVGINQDIFGEEFELPLDEIIVEKIYNRKAIGFQDIYNILNNPVIYFNKLPNQQKSNIEELLACKLHAEGQIDELFTTKVKGPESPMLTMYIDTLAQYVIEQLDENDEIDDMEDLEKKAYEKCEYKGKTLEQVKNEALDFKNYFRYLLNKKDKKVITEQELEFANNLSNVINHGNFPYRNKKGKFNKELILEDNNFSKKLYLSDVVPYFYEAGDAITVLMYTKITDDISNIHKYIEEGGIDLKIGMTSHIIDTNYNKKGRQVHPYLLVFDNSYNYKILNIKSSTILKLKKRFVERITNFDKLYEETEITMTPIHLRNLQSI